MSRLLNSLNKAHSERNKDAQKMLDADVPAMASDDQEPGYFWTSVVLLVLVCGLIVGGYTLLSDRMAGLLQWLP